MIAPRLLFALALRSLLVHKLRSVLSILGVVFGVSAVVAMSSVGEGARREAIAQVGALGIDGITVRQRPTDDLSAGGLRIRDADSLRAVVPRAVAVAPVREATVVAEAGSRHLEVTVVGTVPGYREAARLALASGRFLSALDVSDRKRAAILGAGVSRALFPLADPLTERIRLGGDWYDVVGVLESRASGRARSGPIRTRDVNQTIFVPLPSLDRGGDTRPDGIDEIVLRLEDGDAVLPAAQVVRTVIERTSGAPVEIVVPREILRQKERTQRIFNVVTGAIAGISLIVGGIGIMNIMLASVAERTREVGIRRALGATREDIASHFLVESSLLTMAGGAIGIVLGLVGSVLIQLLAGWPTALSPGMLVLSLLTALLVGVGFGFYPAWLAAHLEPMEALRRE